MNMSKAFSRVLRTGALCGGLMAMVSQVPPASSAVPAFQAPPPTPKVPGLVGYWSADPDTGTTAKDNSQTFPANDGTYQGATVAMAAPPVPSGNQKSYLFSAASNQYIDIPDSPSLSITGPLTLAAWVRRTNTDSSHQKGIIEKFDAGGNGYILRLDFAEHFSFTIYSGANGQGISTAGTAVPFRGSDLNTWNHVAGVFNPLVTPNMAIYKDGNKDATDSANQGMDPVSPPTDGSSNLQLGKDYGTNAFTGNIDEVRIYNRALNQPEVDILRTMVQPPATSPLILGGNQVDLSWTAPTNAATVNVTYSILRGTSAGVYDTIFEPIFTTSYTDVPPATGTYYYAIVAVSVIAGANSTEVSAMFTNTPPPPPPPPRTTTVGQNKHHRCGCSTLTPATLPIPFAGTAALLLAILAGARRRR